jgi:TetR/AcrR family transcriptional regulator, fatty acid metabolism regulator protein
VAVDKSDRGKNIIEAALKVFSSKGYADTRMADIAREAGMSYGLIYHYYENKEKLFDAIVEDWWAGFYHELESLKNSTVSTEEKIVGIIHYLLSVYENKPDQISIFVTEVSRGFVYHAHSKGKSKFNRLFDFCREILEEGQKNGFLRTDIQARYLTYVFLGSIDTFLSVMILGGEKMTPSRENRITEGITKVFLRGAARQSIEKA